MTASGDSYPLVSQEFSLKLPEDGARKSVTLYHYPGCSKSRATLALLESRGFVPRVIDYLKTPPSAAELELLLAQLGMRPLELMRTGEKEYQSKVAAKVADRALTDAQLIALMADNPILIERPIVVVEGRAAIGRPPENVLSLFN